MKQTKHGSFNPCQYIGIWIRNTLHIVHDKMLIFILNWMAPFKNISVTIQQNNPRVIEITIIVKSFLIINWFIHSLSGTCSARAPLHITTILIINRLKNSPETAITERNSLNKQKPRPYYIWNTSSANISLECNYSDLFNDIHVNSANVKKKSIFWFWHVGEIKNYCTETCCFRIAWKT